MTDLPDNFKIWTDFAKACLPGGENFDPFDADAVATLSGAPETCTDDCKAKMEAWVDPATGWGCCVASLLSGFEVMDDLKGFPGASPLPHPCSLARRHGVPHVVPSLRRQS